MMSKRILLVIGTFLVLVLALAGCAAPPATTAGEPTATTAGEAAGEAKQQQPTGWRFSRGGHQAAKQPRSRPSLTPTAPSILMSRS